MVYLHRVHTWVKHALRAAARCVAFVSELLAAAAAAVCLEKHCLGCLRSTCVVGFPWLLGIYTFNTDPCWPCLVLGTVAVHYFGSTYCAIPTTAACLPACLPAFLSWVVCSRPGRLLLCRIRASKIVVLRYVRNDGVIIMC